MDELEAKEFQEPFRHWVIDGYYPVDPFFHKILARARVACPWVNYDNDCERKRSCNVTDDLPALVNLAICDLLLDDVGFGNITGIHGISGDDTLHGGGLHVTDPGGFLAPHIDYALHPHLVGMERRLNAILFLDDWQETWGGALCFYDDTGSEVITRIYPKRGRLVLWEPTDTSFHGCEVVSGPQSRHTIAVYYLAPARPTATRKRALVVPQRNKRTT